jgi:hypothetical protein
VQQGGNKMIELQKYAENKTFMKKLKQAKDDGSLTFEFNETA